MTPLSQSREDAQELNKPLMTPRTQIRIGNWNVRTMFTAGKSTQVARVMNQMKIQIMGISECRWIGAGRMKLSSGETVLYSGQDDDQLMQGVAIMMTPEATKARENDKGKILLQVCQAYNDTHVRANQRC